MKNNLKLDKLTQGWTERVSVLLPMVNKLHFKLPDENLNRFKSMVCTMVANHGKVYTIKRLKAMRLVLHQYALGQTVTPVPFCKADKDGFPRSINFLKPKLDDVYSVRYSFSVMRIIESFRMKPEYSVNTIIEESKADENLINEISDYIQTCPVVKLIPPLGQSTLVMSNKAGPNGPASITAIQDLTALRLHEPELLQSIKQLMVYTIPGFNTEHYKSHEDKGFKASKLVLLSDKACKTRVIAIADWWTNSALNAIHVGCMKALSRLPGDVTYRQSDIPKLVKGLGNQLFSSDMTAFTDRFPRKLEVSLLTAAYGAKISGLWEQVVSNRTFHHQLGGVRYNCGNPMGLLSSWPVSTLTHHAVKLWCANKLGIKHKYLILGDDTLDSNREVHNLYTETIKRLGVSISLSKCTQSESGSTEFAKRHFLNHIEVTGLPVHLMEEVLQMPEQLLELVRLCRERGYEDEFLGPSFSLLISKHKNAKLLADMLSLPESVLGMPPLLGATQSGWTQILSGLPEEVLKDHLEQSRSCVFWETTAELNQLGPPKEVCEVHVEENHPLLLALSAKMEDYLLMTGDEYSIYNEWLKGNYREMALVPTIDVYRTRNKGHFATKCKYKVLKKLLALASGDCNVLLYPRTPVSNFELFQRSFEVSYYGP